MKFVNKSYANLKKIAENKRPTFFLKMFAEN